MLHSIVAIKSVQVVRIIFTISGTIIRNDSVLILWVFCKEEDYQKSWCQKTIRVRSPRISRQIFLPITYFRVMDGMILPNKLFAGKNMTKQNLKILQSLKWLSIASMFSGSVQLLGSYLSKSNISGGVGVAMVVIGIVGLNTHLLLKSLFNRIDQLEKNANNH